MFLDVFILVGIGIILGLALSFLEVQWKRKRLREMHQQQIASLVGQEWKSQTLLHTSVRQGSQSSCPENQALLNRKPPMLKDIVANKNFKKAKEAINQTNQYSSPNIPVDLGRNDSQRRTSDEFGFGALESGMPITRAIRDGHYGNATDTAADKEVELTLRKPVAQI